MTKYCNNHSCVDRDLCQHTDPDNELPDHSNVFFGRGFDNKRVLSISEIGKFNSLCQSN